jgi:hypothetical protein
MRVVVSGAALLLAGLLAGGAPSAPTKTPKLTAAEKAALTVKTASAVGVDGLGLVVTVTFRGNIERAIGRGNLEHALVAMLLTPKGSSRPTEGLVTQGAGAVGTTLQRTRAKRVGVVRNGPVLTFFISGQTATVGSITVKSFATSPTSSFRARRITTAAGTPAIPPGTWEGITSRVAVSENRGSGGVPEGDCLYLAGVAELVGREEAAAKYNGRSLRKLQQAMAGAIEELQRGQGKVTEGEVKKLADEFGAFAGAKLSVEGTRSELVAEFKQGVETLKILIARNDAAIAALRKLAVKATAAIDDAPCAIKAVFSQATRTTTYTWGVGDREKFDYYFDWALLPPANDPTCNNRGTLASDEASFDWYHGDDVCDHSKEDPARGHVGTVALEARFFSTTCKAAYFGTVSGTGPRATCSRRG